MVDRGPVVPEVDTVAEVVGDVLGDAEIE